MAQSADEPSQESSSSDVEEHDIPIQKKKPRRPKRKSRHAVYRGIPGFYPSAFVSAPPMHAYAMSAIGPPNSVPDPNFGIPNPPELIANYPPEMIMYQQHHNSIVLNELQCGVGDLNSVPNLQTWDRSRPPLFCGIIPRGSGGVSSHI